MGQIKNIKLHIVTDIKAVKSSGSTMKSCGLFLAVLLVMQVGLSTEWFYKDIKQAVNRAVKAVKDDSSETCDDDNCFSNWRLRDKMAKKAGLFYRRCPYKGCYCYGAPRC